MTGTLVVLVIMLIAQLSVKLLALAATLFLARRNGLTVKSMSWSFRGYTAEFHEPVEPQSGNI